MKRTTVRITVDDEGTHISVETDTEVNDSPTPMEGRDSQLDAMVEAVGIRTDNPIGFHANIEPDDGRFP